MARTPAIQPGLMAGTQFLVVQPIRIIGLTTNAYSCLNNGHALRGSRTIADLSKCNNVLRLTGAHRNEDRRFRAWLAENPRLCQLLYVSTQSIPGGPRGSLGLTLSRG